MLQRAVTARKPFNLIAMLMVIVHFCSAKQRKSKNCPLSSNPPHTKSFGLHSQPAPAWHEFGPLISMRKHSICIGAYDWKNRSWLFARFGILSWNQTKLARICELVILCLLKWGNVCKRCFENLFFLSENRCLGGVWQHPLCQTVQLWQLLAWGMAKMQSISDQNIIFIWKLITVSALV